MPAEYASQRLTLKAYADRVCVCPEDRLFPRHPRSDNQHRDFENPDRPNASLGRTAGAPAASAC